MANKFAFVFYKKDTLKSNFSAPESFGAGCSCAACQITAHEVNRIFFSHLGLEFEVFLPLSWDDQGQHWGSCQSPAWY